MFARALPFGKVPKFLLIVFCFLFVYLKIEFQIVCRYKGFRREYERVLGFARETRRGTLSWLFNRNLGGEGITLGLS